jgi:hypothetical protein
MSMALYHSQKVCPGPSISSGGIRKIVSESPWAFWSQWEGNPNRYPEKEESDALILGKAAHALILGDDAFNDQFIYLPEDAPSRPTKTQVAAFERTGKWSDAAAAGAAFWAEFDKRANGRSLLTAEQVTRIGYMAENIRRCPEAVEALTGHLTEVSMIWQDEITGVWLKSRPDVIPDNGADFGDLKTFAPRTKSIQRAVHQAITESGYALQMALAVMGAEIVFGAGARECILVMAQSSAPFTVTPVRLDEEALYWARVQVRHGIDTFARCLASGHWPMPVEGIMTYTLPDSVLHRFGEAQMNGDLPNIERNAA